MRRSEAARYARWSASVAVLLAFLTAGTYLQRKWVAHRDRRNAPPPAPVNVKRQLTHGLTFSKAEGNRKIFTVEASKSTDFRDKDSTLLESVKITIFGNTGERHDVIHTESCQYGKTNGGIDCSGDVQMDLETAADAERAAGDPNGAPPQIVHVATRGVNFDRSNGIARSDQPVTFSFPSGTGKAVGVEYNSDKGTVRLLKDVQFTLQEPSAPVVTKQAARPGFRSQVKVNGNSLDFDRETRRMVLHGPAQATTETAQLNADEMVLDLDAAFRAELFRAEKGPPGLRPRLLLHAPNGASELVADSLLARLAPDGWLVKVEASGGVHGWHQADAERDEFDSAAAVLDLWPRVTQPKQLDLTGAVVVKSRAKTAAASRTLETESLRLSFSGGTPGQASKIQLAETLALGSLDWADAVSTGPAPRTHLVADRLQLNFTEPGKPNQLLANGNVRMERTTPGRPVQTATAKSGTAELQAAGWSQMDLQGDVQLKEPDRSARAQHATFRRAEQTAALSGNPVVRDATSQTSAARITFHQATREIFAEGGVRSTDLSTHASALQLAPAPLNVSADSMQANSATGRAVYSRHARLWQGDSVMEADTIELQRSARVLIATDNVRAAFLQAAAQAQSSARPTAKGPSLWHITAETLTYYDAENRSHLEGDVFAQSAEEKIRSSVMDLYFTRGVAVANAGSVAAPAPSSAAAGPQQISRAVAAGGVAVEEGTRKATAERGEYTSADGKFVMTGGNPTLYDGSRGTTTGRKLTFFLADDTIIVDSQAGSRTLTKHKVE